ncbi:MAG: sugar ABC transporter ATP-binding protein [Polyangiaceae bacterium]|nr:sugar ABC transporter ATP-binding protein [Polyangiaceae bacterium]
MDPRLVVDSVKKAFGRTAALRGASLEAGAGEILAVVGQNGAGKSTLMGILAGAIRADAGEIRLDGRPYTPRSPLDARRAGVAMVHQELSLCPHLSVAENILLGALPTRAGLVDRREMHRRAAAALEPLTGGAEHARIDLRAPVADLPPAAAQLVEIARALALASCRVLILDEPTSSLAARDVERLFTVLRRLAGGGLTILYLSHFLEEVKSIADRFVVLRDGETAGRGEVASASVDDIVRLMAGRPVGVLFPRTERRPGDVVLEVTELPGAPLSLRRGEVLGIAGLVGAGRTELLRAVFGLDPVRRGVIRVGARLGPATPAERIAAGMGLLSEDRKGEGLAAARSIADNLTLSRLDGLGPGPLVLGARQDAAAASWIDRLAIRCRSPRQPVAELSGGNQQKVALARLLHDGADVLLLDEPTRGVDVESKAQIYALIDAQAAAGKAVLMVSSYLPELLGACDRIQVMRRGALGPARPAASLDEHALLREAAA